MVFPIRPGKPTLLALDGYKMSNQPDLFYEVLKYHANTPHGVAFSRVCPKCGKFWTDRSLWLAENDLIGTEDKSVIYKSRGITLATTIRTIIYGHRGCGGKMLDEGESLGSKRRQK